MRRKILFDPESQSNAARRATTVAEKNKIETGQPDERRYRAFIAIEWARTVSVRRFLVFPAAASRAVEKCASLLLASWMTGWRDPGSRGTEAEKKRGETSGGEAKKKRGKKEREQRRRRRSSIYHPAKWARWTGLETSRLEAPRFARAQPTVSDDKTGSATLQRDVLCCDLTARFSRAFGCAIILHPTRLNQR